MKKIIFTLFYFLCLNSFAQNKTKIITTILDEYIKKECLANGIDKNEILITVNIKSFESNTIYISLQIQPLFAYPNDVNTKTYKNVRVLFYFNNVSKELMSQINKNFKSINEIRNIEDSDIVTIYEPRSSIYFELNNNDQNTLNGHN